MGRQTSKLTAKYIAKELPPGLYGDGAGLYLQVSAYKTKSWVFRFMIAGRARKMGLGDFDRLSLAEARKKAHAAYLLVGDGIDPIDQRNAVKAVRVAQTRVKTFKHCAEAYIADHKGKWKNEKHAAQWSSTLETYAYPVIGHLPVDAVDQDHVLKIIKPIWATKTETANRVRGRIEQILGWAKVHRYRSGDNPAQWRGFLDQVLPARNAVSPVEHHPALPYAELPGFMKKLRAKESISARALELTILTAMRTDATIGARRAEFDLKDATWTVPSTRLKSRKGAARRDLVIPLPARAVTFLKALPDMGEFMFPGGKEGAGLSSAAMDQMLKGMGYPGNVATVHGFRSTFKDWATDETDYENDLVEYAYGHTVPDKVEAAYRRGNMIRKRRALMDDWAAYCGGPAK